MKTSRLLAVIGVVVVSTALVWQARTIIALRAEATALRKDLRAALEGGLDNPADVSSEPEQARREKLELIKLRHQVRDLNENLVESHARERMANVRSVVRLLLPTPTAGPWNFRPEWKGMESLATNQYAQAMQALVGATNEHVRFLNLSSAAKMSLAVGRTEDARRFATDLLLLSDKFSRGDPERADGESVHSGHLVLGRIALDEGQIEEAKRHLLASGKNNGSPSLGSFGPNMSLAKELLERGEQQTVLQYLELCRVFWTMGSDKLDEWTEDIHAGRIPEFGGNLLH